jgi:hypothetical protein
MRRWVIHTKLDGWRWGGDDRITTRFNEDTISSQFLFMCEKWNTKKICSCGAFFFFALFTFDCISAIYLCAIYFLFPIVCNAIRFIVRVMMKKISIEGLENLKSVKNHWASISFKCMELRAIERAQIKKKFTPSTTLFMF